MNYHASNIFLILLCLLYSIYEINAENQDTCQDISTLGDPISQTGPSIVHQCITPKIANGRYAKNGCILFDILSDCFIFLITFVPHVFCVDVSRRVDEYNANHDDSMRDNRQSNTRRRAEEENISYDSLAYSDSYAPPNSIVRSNSERSSSSISIKGSFGLEENVPFDKSGTWKTSNRKYEISTTQESMMDHELLQHPAMTFDGEAIVVSAPPGKLGFVVETPLNRAPMVNFVRETSVVADRIQKGDYLMSLDREDTTGMSASFLCHLIKSKESNPKREMVFFRPSSSLEKVYLDMMLNKLSKNNSEE